MRALAALVVVLFYAVPSQAASVALWKGALADMTVATVRAKFPEAISPAVPSKLTDGASCEVKIENVSVVDATFEVCFYFLNGKLVQTTLTLDPGVSASRALVIFDHVTDALREKYGKEISLRDNSGPSLIIHEGNWISGQLGVSVVLITMKNSQTQTLNINYKLRDSRNRENL